MLNECMNVCVLLCTMCPIHPNHDKEITKDDTSLNFVCILYLPTQLIKILTSNNNYIYSDLLFLKGL